MAASRHFLNVLYVCHSATGFNTEVLRLDSFVQHFAPVSFGTIKAARVFSRT